MVVYSPQLFPSFDSVTEPAHEVLLSTHARTRYVPAVVKVYEAESAVEAPFAREDTLLAAISAPFSIWKIFGNAPAAADPPFATEEDRVTGLSSVADAGDTPPAVRSACGAPVTVTVADALAVGGAVAPVPPLQV